jgi:hypothetical protein
LSILHQDAKEFLLEVDIARLGFEFSNGCLATQADLEIRLIEQLQVFGAEIAFCILVGGCIVLRLLRGELCIQFLEFAQQDLEGFGLSSRLLIGRCRRGRGYSSSLRSLDGLVSLRNKIWSSSLIYNIWSRRGLRNVNKTIVVVIIPKFSLWF